MDVQLWMCWMLSKPGWNSVLKTYLWKKNLERTGDQDKAEPWQRKVSQVAIKLSAHKRTTERNNRCDFFFLTEDFGTFKDKFATVVARKLVLFNYLCCRTWFQSTPTCDCHINAWSHLDNKNPNCIYAAVPPSPGKLSFGSFKIIFKTRHKKPLDHMS